MAGQQHQSATGKVETKNSDVHFATTWQRRFARKTTPHTTTGRGWFFFYGWTDGFPSVLAADPSPNHRWVLCSNESDARITYNMHQMIYIQYLTWMGTSFYFSCIVMCLTDSVDWIDGPCYGRVDGSWERIASPKHFNQQNLFLTHHLAWRVFYIIYKSFLFTWTVRRCFLGRSFVVIFVSPERNKLFHRRVW